MDWHLHELTLNAALRAEEIASLVSADSLPSSLANRLAVMLAISSMEGIAYQLKDAIADGASEKKEWSKVLSYFSAGADEQIYIDDNGTLKTRSKRHRSLPHILFSLRFAAFCLDLEFNPIHVKGWRFVKGTFNVDDRVIHPQKEADLNVSVTERDNALKAFLWFKRCLLKIEQAS